jgi:CRISPR-associated Cas5-like protein
MLQLGDMQITHFYRFSCFDLVHCRVFRWHTSSEVLFHLWSQSFRSFVRRVVRFTVSVILPSALASCFYSHV